LAQAAPTLVETNVEMEQTDDSKSNSLANISLANIFFSDEISTNIFWSLFRSTKFGIALSDKHGNVSIANDIFNSQFLAGGNYDSVADLINYSENETLKSGVQEFLACGNSLTIKVKRITLPQNNLAVSYMWMTDASYEFENKRKIIFVKNLYRSFLDNTFELVFRSSREGNIQFANKLFIKTFGFNSNRKVRGFLMQELFNDPADYAVLINNILSVKKIIDERVFFKKLDGGRIIARVNCHLRNDEHGTEVFNWTILNITQYVEFEDSLQLKNEQLAKLNLQMERFLYSASHDLRSPLTSIMGLVNLVRMETQNTSILECIDKIETSTNKLDKIIHDIMSFSKTTYQRLKSDRIDFESLVWKIINYYSVEENFRTIAFTVKVEGAAKFYSDNERVEIILENLIRNAIHFYDTNKLNPFIKVCINQQSENVTIQVIDNGVGISPQHIDNVFNMFYKASLNSRGAGLGLYIVKEGLAQLKGSIKVESEIGFGCVFTITIPNGSKGKLISRKQALLAASEM
jgi:PAS domain S-box-containing protein